MPTKTARHKRPAARKPAPKAPRTVAVRPTMIQKSQVALFELDIRIGAKPDRVWRALGRRPEPDTGMQVVAPRRAEVGDGGAIGGVGAGHKLARRGTGRKRVHRFPA